MGFTQKLHSRWRILYIERHFYERWQSIIGHVKAGRVRIYKLNTFKALTDEENEIYNDKKKKNADLLEAIHNNKSVREVSDKYLNERNEIAIFENDIVRLALADRECEKCDITLTKVGSIGFSAMMHGYMAFDKECGNC